MAGTQEIVVRNASNLVALKEIEDALLTGKRPAEISEQDAEALSQQLVEQLLAADTDAALERPEAEGWADYVGHPFEIHDFAWRPSTYDEGHPVFLIVRAVSLVDGEPRILTTGSGQAMAQLANLARRGRLPVVRELASAETKVKKHTVYWLKTPDSIVAERRRLAAERIAAGQVVTVEPGEDPGDSTDTSDDK